MRLLAIGLGLGGQTIADTLLTEQRRLIAHAMIYELMRLPPLSPLDATRRRFGVEGLRRAYRDNVMVVLDASTRLIEKFVESGLQVVVTSDHGELLGEDNMFSHPCGSNNRILRKVPLLKVRSVKGSRPDLARVAYSAKVAAIREKVLRSDVLNASTD